MNLFLLRWAQRGTADEAAAAQALESYARELPYLDAGDTASWRAPSGRAAFAWLAHRPELLGGVRYVHTEERAAALWAGRPVRWHGDEADGRGPLDPRSYLDPAWVDELDGRCTAARYDDATGALELFSDPLGAYPVFAARDEDGTWLSNNAELLRRRAGSAALDPGALAALLGGGWPLTGDPIWAAVRRVPRGVVLRLAPEGERTTELLPAAEVAALFAPRAFDAEAAAARIVESLRALADWPGRPDLVPVTGGRDSRVILAAALRAGLDFTAVTSGPPDAPDVTAAQALCARAGIAHHRLDEPPGGSLLRDHRTAAARTALTTAGTSSAEAASGLPEDRVPGPLVLWHSGQGGEVARSVYGPAPAGGLPAVADHLFRTFVARAPGRRELLSAEGEAIVREQIEGWARDLTAAGASVADLPDAFYLLHRMGTWAGPGHGAVEWVRDTTSPLWSRRVVPDMLAVPAAGRKREAFHRRVLEVLAPELVDVPFAGPGWATDDSRWTRRRRRALRLARRAVEEARRRASWARTPAPPPAAAPSADPLTALMGDLAARIRAAPDHPALAPVDRDRALDLLGRPPASLDLIRHAQVMRLATVLAAVDLAERDAA